jgi:hypothetical protein
VRFVERQVEKSRSERAATAKTAKPGSLLMLLETSMDVPYERDAVTPENRRESYPHETRRSDPLGLEAPRVKRPRRARPETVL